MPRTGRQLCAIGALVCALASITLAVVVLWNNWLPLLGAVFALVVAMTAAWYVITRTGLVRVIAIAIVVSALVIGTATLLGNHSVAGILAVAALTLASAALARSALRPDAVARADPTSGAAPEPSTRPVLILNPRSGGGKAGPALAAAANARGIETIVLEPGDDLEALARDAVARGADAIGMAGGDGSQALVAGVAAEHDVAFVCVPAGTRNHFALDLGVDRADLVGALDAFTSGRERRVDLGRVNGRVFVNNVSFGIYAVIVQSEEYRADKLGTSARMLPELLGNDFDAFDFELDGPAEVGRARPDLILVSNNVYKLAGIGGLGTRARLDEGVLGVIVVDVRNAADLTQLVTLSTAGRGPAFSGWHEWVTPTLELRSGQAVDAGIDGEAVTLEPPVRLEILPSALRVRIARHHPGVSPAGIADSVQQGGVRRLMALALHGGAR